MQALFIAAALSASIPSDPSSLKALLGVQVVGNVRFDEQLNAAKAIGFRNIRLAVRANEVVDRTGRYSWSVADARILTVLRSGYRPIITIFGIPTMGGQVSPPTEQAAAYAEFAAQTVSHFGAGASGRPIIYELWNEPNTKTFWGVAPNPEAYSDMAAKACEVIKRVAPKATVVGLAMEGTPVKAPYFVPAYHIDIYREWATRALTPRLAECLDGLSMHPYRPQPETYITDEPGLAAFLNRSWGKPTPPLIVNSEWGYAVDRRKSVSQAEQASLDVRAALIGASFGRMTSIYTSADPMNPTAPPDDGYGLVEGDGAEKLAAKAMHTLLSEVGDCEPRQARAVPRHDGVFSVTFDCKLASVQTRAIAIWGTGGDSVIGTDDLGLQGGFRVVSLVDTGAPIEVGGRIRVSQMPLLLWPK